MQNDSAKPIAALELFAFWEGKPADDISQYISRQVNLNNLKQIHFKGIRMLKFG